MAGFWHRNQEAERRGLGASCRSGHLPVLRDDRQQSRRSAALIGSLKADFRAASQRRWSRECWRNAGQRAWKNAAAANRSLIGL